LLFYEIIVNGFEQSFLLSAGHSPWLLDPKSAVNFRPMMYHRFSANMYHLLSP
jgi:hypothetical protein